MFGKTITNHPKHWAEPSHMWTRILALRPDIVLDIGANTGQFGRELRSAGYAGHLISFEPQPDAFAELVSCSMGDDQWECHCLALGDNSETRDMRVSAFSPSSSLLPIDRLHTDLMPYTAEVSSIPVSVVRLDEWAQSAGLEGKRLYLKLDVQGYELPVLRGSARFLSLIEGALVELNFAPLFKGQSKFHEVIGLLDDAGLQLASLISINTHPQTGDWLWADGFFERASRGKQ